MNNKPQVVTVETKTIVRVLLLLSAFAGGIWAIIDLQQQLAWIGLSFFLAVTLDPAVNWVSTILRSGRLLATTVVFTASVAIMAFLGASLVPPLVNQSVALAQQIPHYLQEAQDTNGYIGRFVEQYSLVERAREVQPKIVDHLTASTDTAVGVVVGVFSGLAAFLTILVLTFFMLLEGPHWIKQLWRYVPAIEQSHYHRIVGKMYNIVSGYMIGNLILAGICGSLTSLLLFMTGVPFAIPLGILSGLFTFIPIIGVFLSFVVVCSVAIFTSTTAGVTLAAYFALYSMLDNVLRPIIFGKTIDISPLFVMVAIVLGTAIAGIVGALIAIPVAASLAVIFADIRSRHEHVDAPKPVRPTRA